MIHHEIRGSFAPWEREPAEIYNLSHFPRPAEILLLDTHSFKEECIVLWVTYSLERMAYQPLSENQGSRERSCSALGLGGWDGPREAGLWTEKLGWGSEGRLRPRGAFFQGKGSSFANWFFFFFHCYSFLFILSIRSLHFQHFQGNRASL